MEKRKIPKFKRQNADLKGRVGTSWRKPRGIDNKMRVFKSGYGVSPRIGYRQPRAIRGNHPSGVPEVLVSNMTELEAVKGAAVRIAAKVGAKKKAVLVAKAREKKLKILN